MWRKVVHFFEIVAGAVLFLFGIWKFAGEYRKWGEAEAAEEMYRSMERKIYELRHEPEALEELRDVLHFVDGLYKRTHPRQQFHSLVSLAREAAKIARHRQ